jgi:hypothetical protein
MKINLFLIILSICILRNNSVFCQTKINVVTKPVTKSIAYNKGDKIVINAEAASIDISNNPGNTIELKLYLVAKNKDKKIAEKELEFLKYYIQTQSKTIYMQ